MAKLKIKEVKEYIECVIEAFHEHRINKLNSLKLKTLLNKKNPYLFKAKYVLTADGIVKAIVNAHISSNEETTFGNLLEGLAIFINKKVYNGRKSGIKGVDLEFDKDNKRYLVNIKSGPNWGNSSQISKMVADFKTAIRTLRTSDSQLNCIAVNGCCYGKENNSDKGDYYKYCGQKFWEFISGDKNLYIELIEPIGYKAKEKNDEFMNTYSNLINRFTIEFGQNYCNDDGSIDWKKLVSLNASQ